MTAFLGRPSRLLPTLALLAFSLGAAPGAFAVCGDGVMETGEQCDDGNVVGGDCCSAACTLEAPGSPCDDGNFCTTPDTCTATGACTGAGDPNCGVDLDHFKCYQARIAPGTAPFIRRTVGLADQFESVSTLVAKVQQLCNPVDKNGQGIDDPSHLTCYDAADDRLSRFVRRNVLVRNQFGEQIITLLKPYRLCVPSRKDGQPPTLAIDHFRCYKARLHPSSPPFVERDVMLTDQFESRPARVRASCVRFCTPVDKNGEGIDDPSAHLTCYKLTDLSTDPPFLPRNVTVENQFGDLALSVRSLPHLCVPSTKQPL